MLNTYKTNHLYGYTNKCTMENTTNILTFWFDCDWLTNHYNAYKTDTEDKPIPNNFI
jgi:hypothetical protein